jgi:hypothetical protein
MDTEPRRNPDTEAADTRYSPRMYYFNVDENSASLESIVNRQPR